MPGRHARECRRPARPATTCSGVARRGQIDVGDRPRLRQRVAHRAADHARLGQRRQHRGQRRVAPESRAARFAAPACRSSRRARARARSAHSRIAPARRWCRAATLLPALSQNRRPISRTTTQAVPATNGFDGPRSMAMKRQMMKAANGARNSASSTSRSMRPHSPQLLRQMHQDRRRRAPDVMVRVRPHPVFPPDRPGHVRRWRCGASGSSSTSIGSSNTASTSSGDAPQVAGRAAAAEHRRDPIARCR